MLDHLPIREQLALFEVEVSSVNTNNVNCNTPGSIGGMSSAKGGHAPDSQEQRQDLCNQSTQEADSSVMYLEVEQVHDEVLAAD